MTKDEFKTKLNATIAAKTAEILESKPADQKYLGFFDAKVLTEMVRNIFRSKLETVPPIVEQACLLSEVILAPSTMEKAKLLRAVIAIGGGAAGLVLVLTAVGTALGWGAGVFHIIWFWLAGGTIGGPIMWGASGLAMIAICGYFALSGNPQKDSQRFLNALNGSLDKAIDAIWEGTHEALSR